MPIGVNLRLKPLDKSRFHPSLDPPRIPLKKGDLKRLPVPPFLRGARGDLSLIVKQQSLTEFNVKLTLRRARLSVPTTLHKPGIRCISGSEPRLLQ